MSKEKTITESSRLYELGFHIVGTIDSNKVAGVVDEIRKLIKKHHGDIVLEGELREMTLAYTMVKHVAGVNKKYKQSFFDWIKFTMDADNVANLKTALDSNENIIRFIIVKTVNDFEHSTAKLVAAEEEIVEENNSDNEEKVEEIVESTDDLVETTEEKSEKNENQKIDAAIDELVK